MGPAARRSASTTTARRSWTSGAARATRGPSVAGGHARAVLFHHEGRRLDAHARARGPRAASTTTTRVAATGPSSREAARTAITVRHVLCHEAGLYHDPREHGRPREPRCSTGTTWSGARRAPPLHAPGVAHGYHGLTYGCLVGEIVQRVDRQAVRELIRERARGAARARRPLHRRCPRTQLPRARDADLRPPSERRRRDGRAAMRRVDARDQPRRCGSSRPAAISSIRERSPSAAAARHQRASTSTPRQSLRGCDPGRERDVHGALARAHVRARSRTAASSTARACSRARRRSRAPPTHPEPRRSGA